ncbi:hypothetical protein COT75_05515 [Candidatus Beckwithbacteria bacterium CG10_big_fil_rev_8_21_14_0_10_34_10]|uniref:TNase-like domain-containing protein n=1 Tax=Candidatus Beckwithbacteria bacterium CG10_big_fil_rev_8_21_14_0_10_34_10 TaxID=1974495 RepID=A0A2H0W7P6_9BACT|nr:MAG: hypothetical protein COT75_05515 [Candidatus Beckwithbacteria bacterium CG10_big_fil_rev_8_21_14_0_10_34_10]
MAIKKTFIYLFSFISLLLVGLGIYSPNFLFQDSGVVVKVRDGDTFEFEDGRVIRLLNFDAPELRKGEIETECYALESLEVLKSLVLEKRVYFKTDKNEMDRFGRVLAYVFLKSGKEKIFLNQYLLEIGAGEFFLDTVNLKYQEELIRAAHKGYLEVKGKWSQCAPSDSGCLIKGNLDIYDKRWYHLPSFRHYNQVVMNLNKGDKWFCTEEEAIKAGFQKARE